MDFVIFYGILFLIFLTAKKLKRGKKDRLVSNKTNQRIKTRNFKL